MDRVGKGRSLISRVIVKKASRALKSEGQKFAGGSPRISCRNQESRCDFKGRGEKQEVKESKDASITSGDEKPVQVLDRDAFL